MFNLAQNPPFCQTAVGSWCSVVRPCKPLSVLGFSVIVCLFFCLSVSGCALRFLFFLKSREIFKNNFYSLHYLFSKVFVNASHFLRWLCKLFVHDIIIFYWCSRIPLRSIWQSFGLSVGLRGFGNVLAKCVGYTFFLFLAFPLYSLYKNLWLFFALNVLTKIVKCLESCLRIAGEFIPSFSSSFEFL